MAGGSAVEASSKSVEKSVKKAFYTRPPLEQLLAAYSEIRRYEPLLSARIDFVKQRGRSVAQTGARGGCRM